MADKKNLPMFSSSNTISGAQRPFLAAQRPFPAAAARAAQQPASEAQPPFPAASIAPVTNQVVKTVNNLHLSVSDGPPAYDFVNGSDASEVKVEPPPPPYCWPDNFEEMSEEKKHDDFKMMTFSSLCAKLKSVKFSTQLKEQIEQIKKINNANLRKASTPEERKKIKEENDTRKTAVCAMIGGLRFIEALYDTAKRSHNLQLFNKLKISFDNKQTFAGFPFFRDASASFGFARHVFFQHPDLKHIIIVKCATDDTKIILVHNHPEKGPVILKEIKISHTLSNVPILSYYTPKNPITYTLVANEIEKALKEMQRELSPAEFEKTPKYAYVVGKVGEVYHNYKCNKVTEVVNIMDRMCNAFFTSVFPFFAKYKFLPCSFVDNASFYMDISDESWYETIAVKLLIESLTRGQCFGTASVGKVFGHFLFGKSKGEPICIKHDFGLNNPEFLHNLENPLHDISIYDTILYHFLDDKNLKDFCDVLKASPDPWIGLKGGLVLFIQKFPSQKEGEVLEYPCLYDFIKNFKE